MNVPTGKKGAITNPDIGASGRQANQEKSEPLSNSWRKLDIAMVATIAPILVGFGFWCGVLQTRVDVLREGKVDLDKKSADLNETIDRVIKKLAESSPGFGNGIKKELNSTHQAETDGFAVLDVTDGKKGNLFVTKVQGGPQRPLRGRAVDSESVTVLVPRGMYFRANANGGTLLWFPLRVGDGQKIKATLPVVP